jgi:hypothetical protein
MLRVGGGTHGLLVSHMLISFLKCLKHEVFKTDQNKNKNIEAGNHHLFLKYLDQPNSKLKKKNVEAGKRRGMISLRKMYSKILLCKVVVKTSVNNDF